MLKAMPFLINQSENAKQSNQTHEFKQVWTVMTAFGAGRKKRAKMRVPFHIPYLDTWYHKGAPQARFYL